MKTSAKEWIELLDLEQHPEGGWFKESYRSEEKIKKEHLPDRFSGDRNFATAIYFLLDGHDFSAFHRLKQDELWHFYDGSPLILHIIDQTSNYLKVELGLNPAKNQHPQSVMQAGWLFAAEVRDKKSFTLAGCTVSPGFDFADFEMPGQKELLKKYPQHTSIIKKFSR